MMPRPANVSVIAPVGQAFDRAKTMLFRPFDLAKWLTIGFCAWLATLGEGGFNGGSFDFPSSGRSGDFHREFEQVKTYVLNNLYWILPLVVALVVICFALGVLMIWLSSRGRFMFLHCVARDVSEVSAPWRKFKPQGNSLFWFRFVMNLLGTVTALPLLAVGGVILYRMLSAGKLSPDGVVGLFGIVLVLMVVCCIFLVIATLTADFVVPIMFLRASKCLAAWREFLSLFSANLGRFVLYLLFQIVLQLAIGMITLAIVIASCCLCCVGFCVLMTPYINTVVLLPILIFERSYSLYYLRQYGDDFDVFKPPALPAITPP